MMNSVFSIPSILVLSVAFLTGCTPGQKLTGPVEVRTLDTLVIGAERPNSQKTVDDYSLGRFNPSAERTFELIHSKLELAFDWERQYALGKATLDLRPWFSSTDSLVLDARNFLVHSVHMLNSSGFEPVPYQYDGDKLTIRFPMILAKHDTVQVRIDYTARPAERDQFGGGRAITSDQGLFFINSDGKDPEKPRQIWSQGETEYNSFWFPTIDKPNQRCTQEVLLTVDTVFETLSNGILVSSNFNNDGTRTDYWKLDQPHAPYLCMVAVGDYAVVKDQWRDVPLSYYVEHDFRDHAKDIFAHTPEMLEVFSNLLQFPFPWPKYAQVVVRDYVSGAMENTTASVFGEFVQKRRRELIDNDNDLIVAHELFHQWFGDYVTCESWANLTLNEGFANYSEYLWLEHHAGKDEAEYHRMNEMTGYFRQAATNAHDLIYYDYENMDATFDAHSYNKGGLVLHMLRKMVGDEAFFASLNTYLTDNAYTAVEAADLRLAFEKVTGLDLTRFFDQWFFSSGHPELNIEYQWDAQSSEIRVLVEQIQDPDRYPPIFVLPVTIEVLEERGASPVRHDVLLDRRRQVFTFPAAFKPIYVAFDADEILLAEKTESYNVSELIAQFEYADAFPDRFGAFRDLLALQASGSQDQAGGMNLEPVIIAGMDDASPVIRRMAVEAIDIRNQRMLEMLVWAAQNDPHSEVRVVALGQIAKTGDPGLADHVVDVIQRDSAYPVIAAGLSALPYLDFEKAEEQASTYDHQNNWDVLAGVASIFAFSGDSEYLPFFEKWLPEAEGYAAFDLFESYSTMVAQFPNADSVIGALEVLQTIGCSASDSPWRRVAAYSALESAAELLTDMSEGAADGRQDSLNQVIASIDAFQKAIRSHEVNKGLTRYF